MIEGSQKYQELSDDEKQKIERKSLNFLAQFRKNILDYNNKKKIQEIEQKEQKSLDQLNKEHSVIVQKQNQIYKDFEPNSAMLLYIIDSRNH